MVWRKGFAIASNRAGHLRPFLRVLRPNSEIVSVRIEQPCRSLDRITGYQHLSVL
jgi:hypothetical protein